MNTVTPVACSAAPRTNPYRWFAALAMAGALAFSFAAPGVASANEGGFRHNVLMRGQVLEKEDQTLVVCVEQADGARLRAEAAPGAAVVAIGHDGVVGGGAEGAVDCARIDAVPLQGGLDQFPIALRQAGLGRARILRRFARGVRVRLRCAALGFGRRGGNFGLWFYVQ